MTSKMVSTNQLLSARASISTSDTEGRSEETPRGNTVEEYLTVGGNLPIGGVSYGRQFLDFQPLETVWTYQIRLPIGYNSSRAIPTRIFVTFDPQAVVTLVQRYENANPKIRIISRTPVLPKGQGHSVWVIALSCTDEGEWLLATVSKEADSESHDDERWIHFHAWLFQTFREDAIRLAENNQSRDRVFSELSSRGPECSAKVQAYLTSFSQMAVSSSKRHDRYFFAIEPSDPVLKHDLYLPQQFDTAPGGTVTVGVTFKKEAIESLVDFLLDFDPSTKIISTDPVLSPPYPKVFVTVTGVDAAGKLQMTTINKKLDPLAHSDTRWNELHCWLETAFRDAGRSSSGSDFVEGLKKLFAEERRKGLNEQSFL